MAATETLWAVARRTAETSSECFVGWGNPAEADADVVTLFRSEAEARDVVTRMGRGYEAVAVTMSIRAKDGKSEEVTRAR